MAKQGIKLSDYSFAERRIAFDKSGVPWVIDPEAGTIQLAKVVTEDDKQSAVKPKKRK